MSFELKDSISFEGKEYKEIELNLDKLQATHIDDAEQVFVAQKYKAAGGVMELSKKYSVCVAHVASGLPIELFNKLSGRDYQRLHFEVAGFLNGSE